MFNPTKENVRRFFCTAWRKHQSQQLLAPIEITAAHWIEHHPEYHDLLSDEEAAVAAEFSAEQGQSNPFLHLSMHLAIDEQLSIDQPTGIRAVFAMLTERAGSVHAAAHEAMECLGKVMWEAQQSTLPTSPEAVSAQYLECLQQRVG
ncbi:MAG TPA: DUF1841 family protein [Burkholderiaceae bacterium]|nr:DUF1841 family protein [Burkholderiaceae bacterium]